MTAVQWIDLPPARGAAAERWAMTLAEVRAEQVTAEGTAGRWAVIWEGAQTSCYSYQRDLRAGLTPGRAAQLDVDGFEFRVQPLGRTGGRLCARWVGEGAKPLEAPQEPQSGAHNVPGARSLIGGPAARGRRPEA